MTTLTPDSSLDEWLQYWEQAHQTTIDLGLDRVTEIKNRLQLQPSCPVVLVGGTNGKGSVCAMLTCMLKAAGYKVGTYTSPHITHYNERIAINGQAVDDQQITQSFAKIAEAQQEIGLSYFEVGTLAAVDIFMRAQVDIIILEIGLGGRLDACNAFDPTVSVVVSVDLDHQDYLGDTREVIGFEKAGIYRAGRAAICADPNPPKTLINYANTIGASLQLLGRDFQYRRMENQWSFIMHQHAKHALPIPALRGQYQMGNAAAALAVIECLSNEIVVSLGAIKQGLLEVEWPGRFQVLAGRPITVLDVGHNPHAARALSISLKKLAFAKRRIAVFSMLKDKDMDTVIEILKDDFDEWFIGGLDIPRGQSVEAIQSRLSEHGISAIFAYPTVLEAWEAAKASADENDRLVVFGSFHTVAEVLTARQQG